MRNLNQSDEKKLKSDTGSPVSYCSKRVKTISQKNLPAALISKTKGHCPGANHNGKLVSRVLVIDDTEAIHEDFRKILGGEDKDADKLEQAEAAILGGASAKNRRCHFAIDSAYQGPEGLEMVRESMLNEMRYELAFVDVRMPPGWDGIETVVKLWEVDPDLQVVICTAYSDHSWEEIFEALGGSDRLVILKKPFDTIEVLQLACTLSEKWRLTQSNRRTIGELQEQLHHSQKMDALGLLAGGVAHDFNNILCVIQGYTQLLGTKTNLDGQTTEGLNEIGKSVQRASSLTRQLLTFSRRQVMEVKSLDLNRVIGQLEKMLTRVIREDVHLRFSYSPEPLIVQGDGDMLSQVLMNLTVNARDAMHEGGELCVSTDLAELDTTQASRHAEAREGRFARLSVSDTGCGISPENLPRIFEPFFTTKGIGKGTGLGLSTVYGIAKQHQGWIEVSSRLNVGTRFEIFLPLSTSAIDLVESRKLEPIEPGGGETVLLVEDEEPVRKLALTILERNGYRVIQAASGVEALACWERHSGEISLLLTDIVMPNGLSGRDLARHLKARSPDICVVFVSGYNPESAQLGADLRDGHNFLRKPFSMQELLQVIRRQLDNRRFQQSGGTQLVALSYGKTLPF